MARVIVDHSRRVLAITAVVTLVAVAMLFRIDVNADITSIVLEGNELGREMAGLQAKYGTAEPINALVGLSDGGTFLEAENLALLAELRDTYAALEGVSAVGTLLPETNPLTGEPITADSVRGLPEPMIASFVATSPLADLLMSEDAQSVLVVVVPGEDPTALARAMADVEPAEGLEVTLAGNPVVFASVIDLLGWFLLVIPPIVIVLLLGTFYATIGDRRLTALAIVPAVLGSLWTFGLIFGLGYKVDIVTVIVPIFVIVMGSADGLHFVTHFQEESTVTGDRHARVVSALRHIGVPMILTTISTAAGFLSLLATGVRPIRQLGVFVAIGITFAGIISFFALPALLSRLDIRPHHHTALLGPRLVGGLKAIARRRWVAGVLTIVIVVGGIVFIPQLEVDSDQLFFFDDDHEVRLAFDRMAAIFGGATPLTGEFAWDPEAGAGELAALAETADRLEALSGVRRVFSVADLAGVLPDAQFEAVLDGSLALPLGDMVADDGLRFVVFPEEFDTDDLRGWVAFADGDDRIRTLTGMPILWDEIARLVLRAQVGSLIAAFGLVTIMLLAAYRKLRQTLIALVPIALTIVALLAFIAASGIQLNLITAIVSSIVIGVGIDYAIHFIAAIEAARGPGAGSADRGCVLRAIDRAGRPIAANALGIALALTALWLSPLKPHGQISMIMWVSMITAGLTTMTVIPALLPREWVARKGAGDRS